jgi:hypothetical protein
MNNLKVKNKYIYPDVIYNMDNNDVTTYRDTDTDEDEKECLFTGEKIDSSKKLYHPYNYLIGNLNEQECYYTYWSLDKIETNGIYIDKYSVINAIMDIKSLIKPQLIKLFNFHTKNYPPESILEYERVLEKRSPENSNINESVLMWGILSDGEKIPLYIPTKKRFMDRGKIGTIISVESNCTPLHLKGRIDKEGTIFMDDKINKKRRGISIIKEEEEDWEPSDIYNLLWYDNKDKLLNDIKVQNSGKLNGGSEELIRFKSNKDVSNNNNINLRNRYKVMIFWNVSSAPINSFVTRILTLTNSITSPIIESRKNLSDEIIHKVDKFMPYPRGTAIIGLYDIKYGGFVNYESDTFLKDLNYIESSEKYDPCQSQKIINYYIKREYYNVEISKKDIAKDFFKDACDVNKDTLLCKKLSNIIDSDNTMIQQKYPTTKYKVNAAPISSLFGAIFLMSNNLNLTKKYNTSISINQLDENKQHKENTTNKKEQILTPELELISYENNNNTNKDHEKKDIPNNINITEELTNKKNINTILKKNNENLSYNIKTNINSNIKNLENKDNEKHSGKNNEKHIEKDNEKYIVKDNEKNTERDNEKHIVKDNEKHTERDNEKHIGKDNEKPIVKDNEKPIVKDNEKDNKKDTSKDKKQTRKTKKRKKKISENKLPPRKSRRIK